MTDREKLLTIIDIFASDYEEKPTSVLVPENRTKLIFTPAGEIKSIIRGGKSYGSEGR